MNKIQRIQTVLRGELPDHVPASFWFHFPKEQAHGRASVDAHLKYFREANLDFLKIMNEHLYEVEVQIKNPSDWRKIKPLPLSSPIFQAQLDEIKMITDALRGESLTATTLFNPFSSGNDASGNLVTEHLKEDPQAVSAGLATIAESLAVFAEACLEAGTDGLYFSAQGGEADRFTDEEWQQYIQPHDLTVLNAVSDRSDFNIIHICRDNVRLERYKDYPGDIINWAAAAPHNLSLEEGKAIFNRTLLGGLDNRGVLVDGTPEQIRQAVYDVIDAFGPRGLIIGADCTLPTEIDVANIRTAVDAAASYPINA